MTEFTKKVIEIIQEIPQGKVLTYGLIAEIAGNPKASRAVSYILHSSSAKYNLPWHRVVGKGGKISLKDGKNEQKARLEDEGVEFNKNCIIDLNTFLFQKKIS